jgi:hypothetical protein
MYFIIAMMSVNAGAPEQGEVSLCRKRFLVALQAACLGDNLVSAISLRKLLVGIQSGHDILEARIGCASILKQWESSASVKSQDQPM